MAVAGSVAPVFRDEGYVASATYDFYHAIIRNNRLYFCRQDGTIGHEPQEESDEYWFLSLDGNFGDAEKLGGETAEQWQTKLDNIQTTSKAKLSTAGWYRVAEYNSVNEASSKGYAGNSCLVVLKRSYNFDQSESHFIYLKSSKKNGAEFCPFLHTASNHLFTKLRYVFDTSTGKEYIEVYYSGTKENRCFFEINHVMDEAYVWKAINFIPTSETVDGVTVTTTYDIPANASPVTDLDLNKLVDGTTSVGNALQLGGKGASEYVNNYRLIGTNYKYRAFLKFNDGTSTIHPVCFLVNGVSDFGRPGTGVWLVEITHRDVGSPLIIITQISQPKSSETVTFGYYMEDNALYFGVYASSSYPGDLAITMLSNNVNRGMTYWSSGSFDTYYNSNTAPTGWTEVAISRTLATTADLTTALAEYVAKTGGIMSGFLDLISAGAKRIGTTRQNSLRNISDSVWSDGTYRLRDETNNEDIITAELGGEKTFNGTATGNLPLTGGTVGNAKTDVFEVRNTSPNSTDVLIKFTGEVGELGYLGFSGFDNPVILTHDRSAFYYLLHSGNIGAFALPITGGTLAAEGFTPLRLKSGDSRTVVHSYVNKDDVSLGSLGFYGENNPILRNTQGVNYSLLHTGISAKVAIQESAPSSTTAIWIDTTNKKTKAYIDGAWTVIA